MNKSQINTVQDRLLIVAMLTAFVSLGAKSQLVSEQQIKFVDPTYIFAHYESADLPSFVYSISSQLFVILLFLGAVIQVLKNRLP